MSRAFVKEPDGDESTGELPELPLSSHPNYVTPTGLAALTARRDGLLAERRHLSAESDPLAVRPALARLARELRYLEARLESAILVEPATAPPGVVGFGCRVTVADEDGVERCFQIVGEDEAAPAAGKVSWISPLARALDGAQVSDLVTWPKPSGEVELEVIAIEG